MAFPPGQKLTSARLNDPLPIVRRKSADETVTNSAGLQDDDDLWFPIPAPNTIWKVDCTLMYSGTTGGDFAVSFFFPTGCRADISKLGYSTSMALEYVAFANYVSGSAITCGGNGAAASLGVTFNVGLSVGANIGNFRIRFSQATAVASEVARMREGSTMSALRLQL